MPYGLFDRFLNHIPFLFVYFLGLCLDHVRHTEQGLEPVGGKSDVQAVGNIFDLIVIVFYRSQVDLCGRVFTDIFDKYIKFDFSTFKRLE